MVDTLSIVHASISNTMAGAALAAPLEAATRAANTSVQALCRDACAQLDSTRDAPPEVQQTALEAVAAQVTDAQANLGAMRTQLESFCAQLTTASEHIQQLQDTSQTLDTQLRERIAEEAQLGDWLHTAALSPAVIRTLLHTPIDDDVHAWKRAVRALDAQLQCVRDDGAPGADAAALAEVRAVGEQAQRLAVARIRPHLLALVQPLRTSVATTMPILQFSVLLPHNQPLYHFLAAHAPRAAGEVQLAYANAARLYYETAFRRYVRELRRLLPRWTEATTTVAAAVRHAPPFPTERLQFAQAHTAAAPAVLAYMSEDGHFRASPEHLFHTLALVFTDTACSEYAFLARFFSAVGMRDAPDTLPPSAMLSLSADEAEEHSTHAAVTNETWRQVMEPAIAHFHEMCDAVLAVPALPLVELVVLATLLQSLLDTARARHCLAPELESVLMRPLLATWALIARALDAEVHALAALGVGRTTAPRSASLLEWWTAPADETPTDLAQRKEPIADTLQRVFHAYAATYTAVLRIHAPLEGTLSSGFARMRAELFRLADEYAAHARAHAPPADAPTPHALCTAVADAVRADARDTQADDEARRWTEHAARLSAP